MVVVVDVVMEMIEVSLVFLHQPSQYLMVFIIHDLSVVVLVDVADVQLSNIRLSLVVVSQRRKP